MTPRQKIAVSLPAELVDRMRRAVKRGLAPSVSAYVEEALTQKTSDDELLQMLDEMLAESGGPPTAAERREAERVLRGTKPRAR